MLNLFRKKMRDRRKRKKMRRKKVRMESRMRVPKTKAIKRNKKNNKKNGAYVINNKLSFRSGINIALNFVYRKRY